MTPLWLQLGLYGAAVALALVKGDWEERVYATASLLASLITLYAGASTLGSNIALESAEDFAAFALIVCITLRSDKAWPPAVASLTLLTLMTEAGQALLHTTAWAYGTAQLIWNVLIEAVLIAGTWSAWRARERGQPSAPRRRAPAGPAQAAPSR